VAPQSSRGSGAGSPIPAWCSTLTEARSRTWHIGRSRAKALLAATASKAAAAAASRPVPAPLASSRARWSLVLLLTCAVGTTVHTKRAAQSGAVTREYRYLMGTSVQVQAIGGDEA